jgi:hypothetical protein
MTPGHSERSEGSGGLHIWIGTSTLNRPIPRTLGMTFQQRMIR